MAEAAFAAINDGGPEGEARESDRENQSHVTNLPSAVLLIIFMFLDLPSKGKVVQVCKKWRKVAYEKCLWQNERAVLELNYIKNRQVYASLEARGVHSIVVVNMPGQPKNLRIMLRNVPGLLELTICRYCVALDRNFYLLHRFKNLRKLRLFHAFITDETLKVVGRSLRELTTLTLSSCGMVTDTGIAYLTGSNGTDGIPGSLKLQSLGLRFCNLISNESLKMISTQLFYLIKLDLYGCHWITDTGIEYLSGRLNLKHLDLSLLGNGITHISFQLMSRGLKILNTLLLDNSTALSELAISHLGNITSLRVLKMSNCNIREEWLVHLSNSKIFFMDISFNENMGTQGLQHLSSMLHLKELDLNLTGVTNEGLEHLSQSLSKIETLNLSGNEEITNAGLEHLTKMVDLKVLDLSVCRKITAVGLLQLATTASPIISLRFYSNFGRLLDAFNTTISTIEEYEMGSDAWMGAVHTMKEIESLLAT